MRIGIVTTSFPRHAEDYAGSFVGDRARQLLAEGHTVDVLAAGDGAVARELEHARLTVTRIAPHADLRAAGLFYGEGAPEALERGGLARWLAAARFSVLLAGAVRMRAHRLDVIESHWLVPSALAALAAAPDHCDQRAYAHSGDVALLERIPFGRTIARRLARGPIAIRFVSDALRSRFAALAGAAVGTVEPLAPLAHEWAPRAGIDGAGRRLGLSRPLVLAVGRLVPIKGHDRLLHACARVQSSAPEAADALDVVILGDGPERARLGRLADELGVRLRLPGFVPRAEVARWLRAADVFVQPSIALANGRSEGAPFATAEARAVGVPVLVESDVARLADRLARIHTAATGV